MNTVIVFPQNGGKNLMQTFVVSACYVTSLDVVGSGVLEFLFRIDLGGRSFVCKK